MPIEIGDILEIPLPDGRRAFCQVVSWEERLGPLIRVYDLVTHERIPVEALKNAQALFPPVVSTVFDAVQTGSWEIIGHLPVGDFSFPAFISSRYDEKTGAVSMWFLWHGQDCTYLGNRLPEECRQLEYLVTWSPSDIVERIETGRVPYPYEELIRDNRFVPRNQGKPGKKSWFRWTKVSY